MDPVVAVPPAIFQIIVQEKREKRIGTTNKYDIHTDLTLHIYHTNICASITKICLF